MRSTLLSGLAVFLALAGCGGGALGPASQDGGGTSVGGRRQSGGASGTGGTASTGGTTGSGGSPSAGGATTDLASTGGTTSSGGLQETGGTIASGGAMASGGASSTGGITGSGGQAGTVDASATGGSVGRDAGNEVGGPCMEPDKTVTSGSGQYCGYTYENWVGTGSATMVVKPDGYSVNWTSGTQFVGREGIRPGSANLILNYSANFQPVGNSYLCLYGWTTSPLAEYYVVDGWGSWRPPGGTSLGTVTSDGGTYDIYKTIRTNQPSIQGTATFPQYWSVRQQKKTSGTITLTNHISAWANKGMNMGTFYEFSMTVEGYLSSGTADVKFSIK